MPVKTRYHPGLVQSIYMLMARGCNRMDVSKALGIKHSTLRLWEQTHPDVADALKKSKLIADLTVENALFKSATGFYYEEDARVKGGGVERMRKWSSPNVAAQIFWLKNRCRDLWTDNPVQDGGQVGPFIIINTTQQVGAASGDGVEVKKITEADYTEIIRKSALVLNAGGNGDTTDSSGNILSEVTDGG